jgi:hypothetical protein
MSRRLHYEIQGRTVILPAVVRDASSGSVLYMVDRVAAQRLVPDAFETIEAAPGKTTLSPFRAAAPMRRPIPSRSATR